MLPSVRTLNVHSVWAIPRRVGCMRGIGAGLAGFLAVTAILLYQVTSGRGETSAIAASTSPEPTATVTASSSSTPLPATQPTRAIPTATKTIAPPAATATTAPVEPTAVEDSANVADEPELEEAGQVADGSVDELQTAEEVVEPDIEEGAASESQLASIDTSDAWS